MINKVVDFEIFVFANNTLPEIYELDSISYFERKILVFVSCLPWLLTKVHILLSKWYEQLF